MESNHSPETVWKWLISTSKFMCQHWPWMLLLMGFGVGILARHVPRPAAPSASESSGAGRTAIHSALRTLSLSADEQYLDVMESDATWRRHDAHTGRELWRSMMAEQPLTKLKIRGSDLVTAGRNQQGRLAILADTRVLWEGDLPQQQAEEVIQSCALCPNSNLAAAVSDRSLWLLELDESHGVTSVHHSLEQPLEEVTWSPSGDRLAIVTADRELLIWDVAQSKIVGRLPSGDAGCRFAAWSGDGRRIVTYGCESVVRVWQADTLTSLRHWQLDSKAVFAAELSYDGRLAAVGQGESIGLWDLDEGIEVSVLTGHDAPVISLRFDHTGAGLFSVDSKNRIIRWSVTDRREIWSLSN